MALASRCPNPLTLPWTNQGTEMETIAVLATAVFTASIIGSMHCVGMCGPLALWAAGAGEKSNRSTLLFSTNLYHLGRLTTYTMAGLAAGWIGQAIDLGGDTLGIQLAAARIVGGLMVLIGLTKLGTLLRQRFHSAKKQQASASESAPQPSWLTRQLLRIRPFVFRLPIPVRATVVGLLTALLPCGWLYSFALIAAGTAQPVLGAVVMSAFWLGSVPALVSLVAGAGVLARRFKTATPVVASLLLILAGCFTASGRGFAGFDQFQTLQGKGDVLQQIEQVGDQTLPCCEVDS